MLTELEMMKPFLKSLDSISPQSDRPQRTYEQTRRLLEENGWAGQKDNIFGFKCENTAFQFTNLK